MDAAVLTAVSCADRTTGKDATRFDRNLLGFKGLGVLCDIWTVLA